MRRYATGWATAVVVAVVCTAVARVLMRLVAVVRHDLTSFSWGGTLGIALVFVVAALGAVTAGMMVAPVVVRALVVLVPSAPLVYLSVALAVTESSDVFILASARNVQVALLAAGIVLAAAVDIVVPLRVGVRLGGARVPTQVAAAV